MEGKTELTSEAKERYFESDLANLSKDIRERFERLALDEKLRMAKENSGKPKGPIPLEKRKEYLDLAKSDKDIEEVRMLMGADHDWNKATSKDGRPPIGGAQDD
jgi:hypothetical protein